MCADQAELLDVVDCDRGPTGRQVLRGSRLAPGDYFQVVHVGLFNRDGKLLIQKRSDNKSNWPSYWDFSAAGAVDAGETSRQAAEREVWEELGLKIDLRGERPRFTYTFQQGFDDYWLVYHDFELSDIRLQSDEVADIRLVDKPTLLAMRDRDEFMDYVFLDSLFETYGMTGTIRSPIHKKSDDSGRV